jgi:2-iminoacetate synthase ThiH
MESAAPSPANSFGTWRSRGKSPSLLEEKIEPEAGSKDEADSIKELLKETGQQPQEKPPDSLGGSRKPGS